MTAPAPAVAPWGSGWTQYSTQLYTPARQSATLYTLTVATGQWWRFIFGQMVWGTDAGVTNREPVLVITAPNASPALFGTPTSVTPSTAAYCTWGISLSAYSSSAANLLHLVTPIPDLLWPPNTTISFRLDIAGATDAAVSVGPAAVELYTPDAAGDLVPVSEPIASPIVV